MLEVYVIKKKFKSLQHPMLVEIMGVYLRNLFVFVNIFIDVFITQELLGTNFY